MSGMQNWVKISAVLLFRLLGSLHFGEEVMNERIINAIRIFGTNATHTHMYIFAHARAFLAARRGETYVLYTYVRMYVWVLICLKGIIGWFLVYVLPAFM